MGVRKTYMVILMALLATITTLYFIIILYVVLFPSTDIQIKMTHMPMMGMMLYVRNFLLYCFKLSKNLNLFIICYIYFLHKIIFAATY